ncbi:MAG: anion permease [Candidatus Nanohaloarchaea archaeon]
MMDLLSVLAVVSSVFMGISIGASSVAPAFGPVNSSGSANVFRSALLAGFFALVGAVVQGGNISSTVGSDLITGDMILLQSVTILLTAAGLVIFSVLTDYPMPTAFTVVGGVVGSAFGFGNMVNWAVLSKVVLYWLMIPFAATGISYVIARLLRKHVSKENSARKLRYLLLAMGSYMAYTTGAAAGLAVGPLKPLGIPAGISLWLGGLSVLAGAWMYSPRIIRAVSFDYSNIGPRRSIAALGTAAFLAQIGIFYGIPISFNEAIIASVIGSGMAGEGSGTETRKTVRTASAWTGAFLLSGFITFLIGTAVTSVH